VMLPLAPMIKMLPLAPMIKCDAPGESERCRHAATASASHGPSEPVNPEPKGQDRVARCDRRFIVRRNHQ
jgi:hypothetical protein